MVIGIDFDGALVEGQPVAWRPGAIVALQLLAQAGHRLVLHTSRACPLAEQQPGQDARQQQDRWYGTGMLDQQVQDHWDRYDQMRDIMQLAGVWHLVEVWQQPGKPECDLYVDGRADQPDWLALRRELGLRWW